MVRRAECFSKGVLMKMKAIVVALPIAMIPLPFWRQTERALRRWASVCRPGHYFDMGKIDSGYNNYANMRGLKDEQMKAHIVSNEFTLGMCYVF